MERRDEDTPSLQQTTPPPAQVGDSQWILTELRSIRDHLDRRFDALDERLRKTENTLSTYRGYGLAAVALLLLLQIALRFFEVDVSQR